MSRLQLLGPVVADRRSELSAQRRLNMYLDVLPGNGDKSIVVARGTPGLQTFSSAFNGNTILGLYWWDQQEYLLTATTAGLYRVGVTGIRTLMDTWDGSGGDMPAAMFADNGQAAMVCIPGITGLQFWNGTTVTRSAFHTVHSGKNPRSVAYVGGRWVANDSRLFYWTYLSSAADEEWDILAGGGFASAETNPDKLTRVFEFKSNLVLFGSSSIETWGVTGDADAPFALIVGSPSGVGLYAPYSVAKASGSLMFIGRGNQGGIGVYRMDGYDPVPVSPPNLEYKWRDYTRKYGARCFCYRMDGHEFYHVSFPGDLSLPDLSDQARPSWLYNLTTDSWSEVSTEGAQHWALYGACIADENAGADSVVTRVIVSNPESGLLHELHPNAYTDHGRNIARQLVLPHVYDANSGNMLAVDRFRLDKSDSGPTPTLMLSRDGGQTYGSAITGSTNEAGTMVQWNALGRAREFTAKLDATGTSGPVTWIGAYAETRGGSK